MSYGTPPPGYGAPYPGYGPPPPTHPKATTVLVLGILSLAACGLLGIPAWVIGNGVLREIDASGGAVGGRGMVQAGRVCGIIATVFLGVAVLTLIGLFVLFGILGIATTTVSTS